MVKRKWINKLFLYAFISALSISCKNSISNKAELFNYINNPSNGLAKVAEIRGIQIKLIFQPWELIAGKRMGKKKIDKDVHGVLKDLSEKYFFVLCLSSHDKELLRQLDFNTYSEIVKVLSFRMGAFISAIPDNGKPVEPLECLFQPTYGLSNSNNLLIVFDKKSIGEFKKLRIVIHEFGLSTGSQSFKFESNNINKLSSLIYPHQYALY